EKCPKRPRTTWTYDASGRAHYGGSAHQPSAPSSSSSSSWTHNRPSVASSSGSSLQRNLFGGEDRPLPTGGGLREDRALPQACGAPSHHHQQHNHQGIGKSIQEFFTGQHAWRGREEHPVKKEDTGSSQGGTKDLFETLRSLRAKIEHGRDARASGGSHPSAN
ncbi:hypothetical protein FOZ62_018539, partial [Perkinsus olseni]